VLGLRVGTNLRLSRHAPTTDHLFSATGADGHFDILTDSGAAQPGCGRLLFSWKRFYIPPITQLATTQSEGRGVQHLQRRPNGFSQVRFQVLSSRHITLALVLPRPTNVGCGRAYRVERCHRERAAAVISISLSQVGTPIGNELQAGTRRADSSTESGYTYSAYAPQIADPAKI